MKPVFDHTFASALDQKYYTRSTYVASSGPASVGGRRTVSRAGGPPSVGCRASDLFGLESQRFLPVM